MFNFPNFNNAICPIEFDNHIYGGVAKVEIFTNIEFGDIRTVMINNRPYFCASDIMNDLGLSTNNMNIYLNNAIKDIIEGIKISIPDYNTTTKYDEKKGDTPPFENGGVAMA